MKFTMKRVSKVAPSPLVSSFLLKPDGSSGLGLMLTLAIVPLLLTS